MKTLVLNDCTMNIFNAVNAPDDNIYFNNKEWCNCVLRNATSMMDERVWRLQQPHSPVMASFLYLQNFRTTGLQKYGLIFRILSVREKHCNYQFT